MSDAVATDVSTTVAEVPCYVAETSPLRSVSTIASR